MSHTDDKKQWTLEIIPAHANRIQVFKDLVSEIFITMIPGTSILSNEEAIDKVIDAGFSPVPHIAARNFETEKDLANFLSTAARLGVKKALLLAGGSGSPVGPFKETLDILQSRAFLDSGIKSVGVAGHPEGNPEDKNCWYSLEKKYAFLQEQQIEMEIVTQWSFAPEKVSAYLTALKKRGITAPVRIGIAGPASLKTLLKYAKVCGVSAAATVVKKQGYKMGRLLVANKPEKFVAEVQGSSNFHLYPFGGLENCAKWLENQ